VQPSNRFSLVGGFSDEDDIAGTGSTDNNANFRANLRGIAHHRGPKLRMTGRTGTLIVDYMQDSTPITISGALKSNIEIIGRLFGQNIDLRNGAALDAPQPGQ